MAHPGPGPLKGLPAPDQGAGTVLTSPKGERYHEQDVQHLFRAIRRGKAHLTRFMIAASNNVLLNCWDTEGKTPLIECCYIKEEVTRDRMVRILKEAGADVNMPDREGRTPLIHACEKRCNDIVRILIQHCNISPDIADKDGNTALIHAAFIGNDIALDILVRHFRRLGLQVDHYNQAGYTALHVAAKSGFLQCAKILAVKGKASLTIKDKVHGLTALEWSLKEGYQKSDVEFLKPSAKFYRLAKLTTTMVKYRKRSSVTSHDSLPQIPDAAKPAKAVDKAKGKVKNLLKKSPQSQDDSDFMAIGSGCVPKQTKSAGNSKAPLAKASSADPSKSKSAGKKTWSKSSRQRSFTLTGNKENLTAPKAALKHSLSNPGPGKSDIGETDMGTCQETCRTTDVPKSLALNKDRPFHDELGGQIDTDEDSSCSETETVSLMESLIKSDTLDLQGHIKGSITCGGVYCGEVSSSSDADRSSYGILSLSQYTDGGVYCGDIKSSDLKDFSASPDASAPKSGTCLQRDPPFKHDADSKSDFPSVSSSVNVPSPGTFDTLTHNLSMQPVHNQQNGNSNKFYDSKQVSGGASSLGIDENISIGRQISESSDYSIPSPLTVMEVVEDIRQNQGVSLLLDKSSEANSLLSRSETEFTDMGDDLSCFTELTQVEGRMSSLTLGNKGDIHWEAGSKQIDQTRCSSADSVSDVSSYTQITLIGGVSKSSLKNHVGNHVHATTHQPTRLVANATNNLENDFAFQTSDDEAFGDDPETDKTYVRGVCDDHMPKENVRKTLNKQSELTCSSSNDKNAILNKRKESCQDKLNSSCGTRFVHDQNKIENITSGDDQTSTLNTKITSLS